MLVGPSLSNVFVMWEKKVYMTLKIVNTFWDTGALGV